MLLATVVVYAISVVMVSLVGLVFTCVFRMWVNRLRTGGNNLRGKVGGRNRFYRLIGLLAKVGVFGVLTWWVRTTLALLVQVWIVV